MIEKSFDESDESFVQVTTEIVGSSNGHTECHHKNYFKFMWLDDNGLPDKSNVFVNKKDAIHYALTRAEADMATKQKAVDDIQQHIYDLKLEDMKT